MLVHSGEGAGGGDIWILSKSEKKFEKSGVDLINTKNEGGRWKVFLYQNFLPGAFQDYRLEDEFG